MMRVRRAILEDAAAVLEWRNDPQSIDASNKSEPVTPADHMNWFSKAIDDPERIMLIAYEDERRLGMVRFDRSGDTWFVSINVAPAERGKGYGTMILRECIAVAGKAPLRAEIKKANKVSAHIFKRCGFHLVAEERNLQQWARFDPKSSG